MSEHEPTARERDYELAFYKANEACSVREDRIEALTAENLALLEEVLALRAKVERIEALANKTDQRRLEMCRACRDPEGFGATHSHDCGETRLAFITALRAALGDDQ